MEAANVERFLWAIVRTLAFVLRWGAKEGHKLGFNINSLKALLKIDFMGKLK